MQKSTEIRVGLVMYGGVSLAIYINGVSREFFDAVQGLGLYKLLKALTDSDIVVDIISGSSAGGINGLFLSYALLNKRDFSATAELWRSVGDIASLLRAPDTPSAACHSLLKSREYYQPSLEDAFRRMPAFTTPYGDRSHAAEVDVFITGTDVYGNIYTVFDDAGHPIDVKDHRTVFLLKHREGRKHPLKPDDTEEFPDGPEVCYSALATLARITSCFPAAFEPVEVAHRADKSLDGKLQTWGNIGKHAFSLDGGVLDNKPFTHTIAEIFQRSADRDVDRLLFYVEPDPERFQGGGDQAPVPTFFQAALQGGGGIKSYESIADDLKMVRDHNSQVELYKRLRLNLRGRLGAFERGVVPSAQFSEPQRTLYMNARLAAISDRAVAGLLRVQGRDQYFQDADRKAAAGLVAAFENFRADGADTLEHFDIYFRLRRLYQVIDRIKTSIYNARNVESRRSWGAPTETVTEIHAMEFTAGGITHPLAPGTTLEGLRNMINGLGPGIKAALLRIDEGRWRLRIRSEGPISLRDVWPRGSLTFEFTAAPPSEVLTRLWRALNRQVKLLEMARFWMEYAIDTIPIEWRGRPAEGVWLDISIAFRRLLNPGGGNSVVPPSYASTEPPDTLLGQEELREVHKAFGHAKNEIDDLFRTNPAFPRATLAPQYTGLLQATNAYETRIFDYFAALSPDEVAEFADEYHEFINLDASIYPMEFLSRLDEKNVIKTVRISPADARRGFCDREVKEKLAGDSLAHFGGFFKRSWRANDILWGRLDGLCQLTECILNRPRLESLLRKDYLRQEIRGRFFDAGGAPHPEMDLETLFPHAGAATVAGVRDWIRHLLDDDETVRGPALEQLPRYLEILIEMGHLEILHQGLPTVLQDAITEQAGWNQFRVEEPAATLTEAKILRQMNDLPYDAARPEDSDRALCVALAPWTGFNPALIDRYYRLRPGANLAAWAAVPAGALLTYGEQVIQESIACALMTYDVDRAVFRPGNGAIDPLVSTVAAENYARLGLGHLLETPALAPEPQKTRLGLFFKYRYRVGSEELARDIPVLVMLETIAHALLVLRGCIVGGLPDQLRQRLERHPLYRWLVDVPLRAAYSTIRVWRREPIAMIVSQAVLFVASVLTIVFAVTWFNPIISDTEGHFHPFRALLMLVVPATIIWLELQYGERLRRWLQAFAGVLIAVAVMIIALALTVFFPGTGQPAAITALFTCVAAGLVVGWLAGRRLF